MVYCNVGDLSYEGYIMPNTPIPTRSILDSFGNRVQCDIKGVVCYYDTKTFFLYILKNSNNTIFSLCGCVHKLSVWAI